jgi:hypothetical protein
MRELRKYTEPALKITCLVLAALVAFQGSGMFARWNPFRGVTIPALPALAVATNSPASGGRSTNQMAAAKGTNSISTVGTNSPQRAAGTNATLAMANSNSVSPPMLPAKGTNLAAQTDPANTNASAGTNVVVALPEIKSGATNLASATNITLSATNLAARNTNGLMMTNAAGTNGVPAARPVRKIPSGASSPMTAGMNPNQPSRRPGSDLPPAVQTRISRIVDSEMLGPVIRPQPMALLGIAGEFAFLRSATGQTGLVKEGDSLGDLKLVKIGVNRVLVEQDGQKKELMIFSGYGGESLLPKQTGTTNENILQ